MTSSKERGVNQSINQSINGYSVEAAVDFLNDNLKEIPNVKTWAERLGYSRSHFSTKIKEYFGISAVELFREVRFKHIRKKILAYPLKTSYSIADMVGLRNDRNMYKFLSRHYDTNFTKLKSELLKGRNYKES